MLFTSRGLSEARARRPSPQASHNVVAVATDPIYLTPLGPHVVHAIQQRRWRPGRLDWIHRHDYLVARRDLSSATHETDRQMT